MKVWWFSWVIARHPWAIVSAVFIFSSTCLIAPLVTTEFPDFSAPQMVNK